MPVSVATKNLLADDCFDSATIPPVDRIFVRSAGRTPSDSRYIAAVEQPHSGWMRSSASGFASAFSRISTAPIPAWTWHSPIHRCIFRPVCRSTCAPRNRSEEHTSELQSRPHLVCRLLLEKKKKNNLRSPRYKKKKKKNEK